MPFMSPVPSVSSVPPLSSVASVASVKSLPSPSSPAPVFAPWRDTSPGQALPWRSLASLGLEPDAGARRAAPAAVGGTRGAPDVVESAPVPSRTISGHRPVRRQP
ncbi:hypothetical protein [Streptomyces bluensis]|uniref:Uncharacterized protein n=1 Tax=Streptomyces bluensis TaxID=33897 RepID=A0ABW6USA8_9ACTN